MTFCCKHWKNDDANGVNAFAKENLRMDQPFLLPLQTRVISLTLPRQNKIWSDKNANQYVISASQFPGNNSECKWMFTIEATSEHQRVSWFNVLPVIDL
jgi:hypothetical protein